MELTLEAGEIDQRQNTRRTLPLLAIVKNP